MLQIKAAQWKESCTTVEGKEKRNKTGSWLLYWHRTRFISGSFPAWFCNDDKLTAHTLLPQYGQVHKHPSMNSCTFIPEVIKGFEKKLLWLCQRHLPHPIILWSLLLRRQLDGEIRWGRFNTGAQLQRLWMSSLTPDDLLKWHFLLHDLEG